MKKAIITFANGENLIIEEEEVFELINPILNDESYSTIEPPPI